MEDNRNSRKCPGRGFLLGFILHLLVPLYLVLDVFSGYWFVETTGLNPDASLWASIGPVGQVVLFIGILWLIAGLGVLALKIIKHRFPWFLLQGPLIGIYGFLIALALAELVLHIVAGSTQPALWPKGRDALLNPNPAFMPGVTGSAKFTGNNVGLRGTDFQNGDDAYTIVTIGGSTTEDLYLDDSETWSNHLMEGLNRVQNDVTVWVGNAGQSGRNTVDHLALMRSLPILGKVDLLVFLVGINDFGATVSFGGTSTQGDLEIHAAQFKEQVLRGGGRVRPSWPYFKRSRLYDLLRTSTLPRVAELAPVGIMERVGVGPGNFLQSVRNKRKNSRIVPVPSLEIGLEEYGQRIKSLSVECQVLEVRCLFMTQPSLYRESLSQEEEDLLWGGWVQLPDGDLGYVEASELAFAIRMFNDELISVCLDKGLNCFDLALEIPKNTSAFYDDVHFNENGARLVGEAVSRELQDQGYLKR